MWSARTAFRAVGSSYCNRPASLKTMLAMTAPACQPGGRPVCAMLACLAMSAAALAGPSCSEVDQGLCLTPSRVSSTLQTANVTRCCAACLADPKCVAWNVNFNRASRARPMHRAPMIRAMPCLSLARAVPAVPCSDSLSGRAVIVTWSISLSVPQPCRATKWPPC